MTAAFLLGMVVGGTLGALLMAVIAATKHVDQIVTAKANRDDGEEIWD